MSILGAGDLRCRRPLLALMDDAGDTAWALREAGCTHIAPLDEADRIAAELDELVHHGNRTTGWIALDAAIVDIHAATARPSSRRSSIQWPDALLRRANLTPA